MAMNGCRLGEKGQALSYLTEKLEEATEGLNAAMGLAREAMEWPPCESCRTNSRQDTTQYCDIHDYPGDVLQKGFYNLRLGMADASNGRVLCEDLTPHTVRTTHPAVPAGSPDSYQFWRTVYHWPISQVSPHFVELDIDPDKQLCSLSV